MAPFYDHSRLFQQNNRQPPHQSQPQQPSYHDQHKTKNKNPLDVLLTRSLKNHYKNNIYPESYHDSQCTLPTDVSFLTTYTIRPLQRQPAQQMLTSIRQKWNEGQTKQHHVTNDVTSPHMKTLLSDKWDKDELDGKNTITTTMTWTWLSSCDLSHPIQPNAHIHAPISVHTDPLTIPQGRKNIKPAQPNFSTMKWCRHIKRTKTITHNDYEFENKKLGPTNKRNNNEDETAHIWSMQKAPHLFN